MQGAGSRVQDSGVRVLGSGFRVQGAGSRVQGREFRIQGLGFWVQGPRGRLAPLALHLERGLRHARQGGDRRHLLGTVLDLRPPTSQNCETVPRRARF